MEILTLLFFFACCYGLGFTATSFVNWPSNLLERSIIRLGIGLCVIPLLGIALSLARIPVDWRIILALSAAYPAFYLYKNYRSFKFHLKVTKSDLYLLAVLVIFALTFFMYHKGAFAYPYLEDDDPWAHAIGVKYVAVEKTFFNEKGGTGYLDPYPPAYDGIMGVLHQTSTSLYWTIKFFNALIISLSILFFFIFVKHFSKNQDIALISTLILAMVPAYVSHFIWAHSLMPILLFISFICLEMIEKQGNKWMFVSAFPISAMFLYSATENLKFIYLFLIYLLVKSIISKKLDLNLAIALFLGLGASMAWWLPLLFRYGGLIGLFKAIGFSHSLGRLGFLNNQMFYVILIAVAASLVAIYLFFIRRMEETKKNIFGISALVILILGYAAAYSFFLNTPGTADRVYDSRDFFIATGTNMINNPVGIGYVAFSLFIIGLFLMLLNIFKTLNSKENTISDSKRFFMKLLTLAAGLSMLISWVTFFLFRLKDGMLLKTYMLSDAQTMNYFRSFQFNIWGIYLLLASFLFISAIYTYLIFKGYMAKEQIWIPILLGWLFYTFGGLYEVIGVLFIFRLWTLFGFVLSIIAAYSFINLPKIFRLSGIFKYAVWALLILGLFYTSGVQKYEVNTSKWSPGGFWNFDLYEGNQPPPNSQYYIWRPDLNGFIYSPELDGYVELRGKLPANTPVFTYYNPAMVIGTDMLIRNWLVDERGYIKKGFNDTAEKTYVWLKERDYKYVVFDAGTFLRFGINETNNKIGKLLNTGKFNVAYQNRGMILLSLA